MRLLLGLLLVVGCKGKPEEKPADKPVEKPAPAAGSAVAPPPVAKPITKPVAKDIPEDPKARTTYRLGMRTGRKATDAKKWPEAIAGFDQALAAKPGDPRALGERGFARLLEGKDLDAASRDLDHAASATKDTKILSSIWFNRGLIEEKRGNTLNASADFVVANTLRPTAAAKAKLAGKSACPSPWATISTWPITSRSMAPTGSRSRRPRGSTTPMRSRRRRPRSNSSPVRRPSPRCRC